MSEDLKPIPVAAAKRMADEFGYHQVVIVARHVGAAGREHVTTYGVDVAHCEVAGRMGNFFKYKLMGWPTPEHEDSPFSQAAQDVLAERNTGGPAFPEMWQNDSGQNATTPDGQLVPPGCTTQLPGMTQRQYLAAKFAAAWVIAISARNPLENNYAVAIEANRLGLLRADGMLEARNG